MKFKRLVRIWATKQRQAKPLGSRGQSSKFWTAHKPECYSKQPKKIFVQQHKEKRSTITQPPLDLAPLIQILTQADREASLGEQLAILELGLVFVELNPNPKLFVHTIQALKTLASISNKNRNWHTTTADLANMFIAKAA